MRKAVVAGIDYYKPLPMLFGCVTDAVSVKRVLEKHADGGPNFGVKDLLGTGPQQPAPRDRLRDMVRWLFADDADIALLYFAGHGHIESTGAYLCASDCRVGDEGLPLAEVVTLANKSRARNKIIILDCCHAGAAGANPAEPLGQQKSELTEGMTILTASTAEQYASESSGSGVFTALLVDALNGAAGNLLGEVTPGSVYAHIDQSLGPWEQRPVFKTNVKTFVSLRTVQAPLVLADLRQIAELFTEAEMIFRLDETFEPQRNGGEPPGTLPPDPANTEKFAVLQKYNRVNLVVPIDAPHMYFAAMNRKGCRLTTLGQHYWQLAKRGRI
jgi:hypothetical protein